VDQFIELTLSGFDALCVDAALCIFEANQDRPDSYRLLCKVPATWIGTDELPQWLFNVAACVNTDQSINLLRQGAMVGHLVLRHIDYRILGDRARDVAGPGRPTGPYWTTCRCQGCCTGDERQKWLQSWPIAPPAIISGRVRNLHRSYLLVQDDGSYQRESASDFFLVGDDGTVTEVKR
jgi:hypothetical protein